MIQSLKDKWAYFWTHAQEGHSGLSNPEADSSVKPVLISLEWPLGSFTDRSLSKVLCFGETAQVREVSALCVRSGVRRMAPCSSRPSRGWVPLSAFSHHSRQEVDCRAGKMLGQGAASLSLQAGCWSCCGTDNGPSPDLQAVQCDLCFPCG